MKFHLLSYESHQNLKHESKLIETWRNKNTVDYWRHHRMYSQLNPLLASYPGSRWLTVGDGRYGTDAHYLQTFGIHATASDINDTYLKHAMETGFISNYAVENAEKLSFEDDHFDFVLCKESYHHFPRPMIALYEMLRVAKTGVVLIEPNDQSILQPYSMGLSSSAFWLWFSLKQWIKKKIGKKGANFTDRYESVGNYVYSISNRELEKVALGMNLDALATKGMNDSYVEGVEFEDLRNNGSLSQKIKGDILRLDNRSSSRSETYGLLVAIIFKVAPNDVCIDQLKQMQFNVKMLQKNPYIKSCI